ncbi:hypothetical protein [Lactococcus lactis]|uniref:LtrD protein n=1 Tax=Lactococcus lactis subsp. lactis TaxID=1360 RepID=A0A0V8E5D4_LACLL|nr:hypothetical protein [Lactococcus lactis]KSU21011.1 hypothetical protein M20_1217 [Lactococcus lactis subsp. lactis]
MSMNEADFKLILSQFLLRDETSENPKIHPQKIEKRKAPIQNNLENYITELINNEVEIDLSDYKAALKQLKKMKAAEYDELVMEIVEDYELMNEKKNKVFPSGSTPYPEQIMNQTIEELSKNKQVIPSDSSKGLEDKNEKSKLFLFSNNRKKGKKN